VNYIARREYIACVKNPNGLQISLTVCIKYSDISSDLNVDVMSSECPTNIYFTIIFYWNNSISLEDLNTRVKRRILHINKISQVERRIKLVKEKSCFRRSNYQLLRSPYSRANLEIWAVRTRKCGRHFSFWRSRTWPESKIADPHISLNFFMRMTRQLCFEMTRADFKPALMDTHTRSETVVFSFKRIKKNFLRSLSIGS